MLVIVLSKLNLIVLYKIKKEKKNKANIDKKTSVKLIIKLNLSLVLCPFIRPSLAKFHCSANFFHMKLYFVNDSVATVEKKIYI